MKQIPQNLILKQNNYSTLFGDIVESFGIDLTDNYAAVRLGRTKEVTNSTVQEDLALTVSFQNLGGSYYALSGSNIWKNGDNPQDSFTKLQASLGNDVPNNLASSISDLAVFNDTLYASAPTSIWKRTNDNDWAEVITSGLTSARPHILTPYADRLYVTDEYYKVHSISSGDAIATTGEFTLDLALDNSWSIKMLQAAENALWIGLLNIDSGEGLVYEWDGSSENDPTREIRLDAGVVAGVILNDVPHIVDMRGRLLKYNGSVFVEIDRFNLKDDKYLTVDRTNSSFINTNGMATSDFGSLLINFSNKDITTTGYEDSCPAGVWEWTKKTGLYHKYALSTSATGSTSRNDYGYSRVFTSGALAFMRPSVGVDSTTNGSLLIGAEISENNYGIYINDTLDTTEKAGYITTAWVFSDNVEDTWAQIYLMYKKLLNSSDKIMVKYRTVEKNSISANCNWLDSTNFTTTADISDVEEGDLITISTGTGAGQLMHVKNISSSSSTYTVEVDSNPLSATGSFVARFENFHGIGEADFAEGRQWKEFTASENNTSPRMQLKIGMIFTGENELHRIRIPNKGNVNN